MPPVPRKPTQPKPPAATDAQDPSGAPVPARPRRRPAAPKPVPPMAEAAPAEPVAAPVPRAATRPPTRRPATAKVSAAPSGVTRAARKPAVESIVEQPKPHSGATLRAAGALPPARIPPELIAVHRDDRLVAWAVGLSVALHAILLAVHFSPLDVKRTLDRGPPIEVALVNAKTKDRPTKADVLAQANLDGGGNTDENRRAKTPLPVLPKETQREDVALATERVQALERKTQELLTQLRSAQAVPTEPKTVDSPERTDSPTANTLMQRTLEAMRLEAQIAKDQDAYQKRPKRRFVGARAEEYRFARYVEDWRLKVERIGNLNYPEAARTQRLYGNLIITVSIRADGTVENVEVDRSSGNRILDAAAVKIVQLAAPYAPFPPDVKRDTDILHITRTWTFTRADQLKSE